MKTFIYLLWTFLLLFSCARVGSPIGGAKDSLAPRYTGSNIDSSRVNISKGLKELRLDFDEYIMLKDINKNLVISPEIKKIKKIIPSNLANKYLLIQWEDSLKANTTYNFNFGNAIIDNNEGNVLPYFNFAFSTGKKLDQLFISGTVSDAMFLQKKNAPPKENKWVVGLYPAEGETDFKKKPVYITKVDEENYFEINYLKKGSYFLLAFEDENQNTVYDPGKEKVGFLKDKIVLNESSIKGLQIKLFPSKKTVKFKEYKAINGGLQMLFEGNPDQVEVHSLSNEWPEYKVTHLPKSDLVNLWIREKNKLEENSSTAIPISFRADQKSDTLTINYKAVKQELTLANKEGNLLPPDHPFKIEANMPVEVLALEKYKLVSDSIEQNFTAKVSPQNPKEIWFNAPFKPGKKYQLLVPKESVKSFYVQNEKSYQFEFEVDKLENYGSFSVQLLPAPKQNFWIELLNEKGEVVYSQFSNKTQFIFSTVKPGIYFARIKVDQNGNHYWDEADFASNSPAEEVYVFEKEIEIRPLWTIEENWEIK